MDRTEHHVLQYLNHCGYSNPIYEPDGNVPPDFLVDGRIAIEVRKLNQHDESPEPRGLEETSIPFDATLGRVLASMGPPRFGVTWYVSYSIRRPIPSKKEIETQVRRTLQEFASVPRVGEEFRLQIGRVRIKLFPRTQALDRMFVVASAIDHDEGGFVVADLVRNLPICIADKTAKIAKRRSRYPVWWLVLVDQIGYGDLNASEIQSLKELVARPAEWDRIVLVSPVSVKHAFDI